MPDVTNFQDFITGRTAKAPLSGTEVVPIVDGGITQKTTAQAIADLAASPATASQAEAEAGTETAIRSFSPLLIFQAIAAKVAASIATLTLAYSSTVKSTQTVDSTGKETHVITDGTSTSTVRIAPNGAMYLEVAGQTAGNARGAGSIDWQSARTAATQVVGGIQSIAVGLNNTVSSDGCIAVGNTNTVTGVRAVCLGTNNAASASTSVAIGNTCISSGNTSIAIGVLAANGIPASLAVGGGVNVGYHQTYTIPLGKTTTDATPTVLDLQNNAAYRPVLPAKSAWHFRALCIAYGPTYKASAWSIEGVICRNNANDTRIVGTPTIALIAQDAEMAGCAVTATADNTNESLAITVTGLAATSIRWTCSTFVSQTIQA